MKRRIRRIANFFAFNLLFFALYLNFIHKDNATQVIPEQNEHATAAFTSAVPVAQPEKYLQKANVSVDASTEVNAEVSNLSVN